MTNHNVRDRRKAVNRSNNVATRSLARPGVMEMLEKCSLDDQLAIVAPQIETPRLTKALFFL